MNHPRSSLCSQQVINLIRRGQHPFDLLGIAHVLPRVTAALSKLLATWHPLYGNAAMNSNQDAYFKDKAQVCGTLC